MSTMTQAAPERLPGASFDRDYWLAHCEGFRVDTANGRLGFVTEIRAGDRPDDALLAVQAGVLGRRVVLVPLDEVEFIVPRAQRIWLHSPTKIVGTESAGGAR